MKNPLTIKFEIKEVKPRIFLFEFEDRYDMAMMFLRYQEYYESPKFRNKDFTILEFMNWYAKEHGGLFTYPRDWAGFNLPSDILSKCLDGIIDINYYDEQMVSAYYKCCDFIGDEPFGNPKFYVIGAMKGNIATLHHEVSHAMFYLDKKYKKEMTALVKKLPKKLHKRLCDYLSEVGYTSQVFTDEIIAYLSTGGADHLNISDKQRAPFIKLFNEYYNK